MSLNLILLILLVCCYVQNLHPQIVDINELNKITESNQKSICVFLGNDNSNEFKKFNKITSNSTLLFWSNSQEILSKYNVTTSSAVIFLKYSKKNKKHKDVVSLKINFQHPKLRKIIKSQISLFSKPSIAILNDSLINKIKKDGFPTILTVLKDKEDTEFFEDTFKTIKLSSKKYRGEFRFIIAFYKENKKYFKDELKLNGNDLPKLVIFDGLDFDYTTKLKKYYSDDTFINEEFIDEFISDYKNKKLETHLHSDEPYHSKSKKSIRRLVTKNFDKFFKKNENKELVILFCIDYDVCSEAEKRLNFVWKKLRNSNDTLNFGVIDLSRNEIETINIEKFPSLILFPIHKKRIDNQILFKDANFTSTNIINFIKQNTLKPLKEIIVVENEEEFTHLEDLNQIKSKIYKIHENKNESNETVHHKVLVNEENDEEEDLFSKIAEQINNERNFKLDDSENADENAFEFKITSYDDHNVVISNSTEKQDL